MNINKYIYYIPLFIVALIWSTTNFITKDLLVSIGPMSILVYRFLTPVILLTIVNLLRKKNILSNWKIGFGTGLFLGVFYCFQNFSLLFTGPVNSSFFLNSFIIFIPFLMFIFEKKPIKFFDIITISLAILGLFFIGGNLGGLGFGDGLCVIGAFLYAIYIVLVNKYASKEDVLVEVNQQFIVVLTIAFIGSFMNRETLSLNISIIPQLLYLSLFPTLFCFLVINWSEKKVNPLLSSLIISLDAVLSAVFAVYIGNIQWTLPLIIGIIIFQIGLLSDNSILRGNIIKIFKK